MYGKPVDNINILPSFGMLHPQRNYNAQEYRLGFNGKENDNEVYGITGSWQDYGERPYNPLIIRFPTPDPIIIYGHKYPELSTYQFASNSPIWAVDLDGLERKIVNIYYNENKTVTKISVVSVLDENQNAINLDITDNQDKNYSSYEYLIVSHFADNTQTLEGADKVDIIIQDIESCDDYKINVGKDNKINNYEISGNKYKSEQVSGTFNVNSADIKGFSFLITTENKPLNSDENKKLTNSANNSLGNYNSVLNSERKSDVEATQTNSTPTNLNVDNTPDNKTEKIVKVQAIPQ